MDDDDDDDVADDVGVVVDEDEEEGEEVASVSKMDVLLLLADSTWLLPLSALTITVGLAT